MRPDRGASCSTLRLQRESHRLGPRLVSSADDEYDHGRQDGDAVAPAPRSPPHPGCGARGGHGFASFRSKARSELQSAHVAGRQAQGGARTGQHGQRRPPVHLERLGDERLVEASDGEVRELVRLACASTDGEMRREEAPRARARSQPGVREGRTRRGGSGAGTRCSGMRRGRGGAPKARSIRESHIRPPALGLFGAVDSKSSSAALT